MSSASQTSLTVLKGAAVPLLLIKIILSRGPDNVRLPLARILAGRLSATRIDASLKWLLAIGAVVQGNNLLSAWARNNWLFRTGKEQWNWPDEVAVVTGGSGGIGALIVKGLAHKGVKVAVFDMQPLPDDLKEGEFRE
jgi:all-trans-retinol dehydrogenase (NAD+)